MNSIISLMIMYAVCDEGRHKPREYPKYMRPEGQVDGSMDCTTCGITLNSVTTYKSHIEGAKHLRKVQQQRKKEELMGRKQQQVCTYSTDSKNMNFKFVLAIPRDPISYVDCSGSCCSPEKFPIASCN